MFINSAISSKETFASLQNHEEPQNCIVDFPVGLGFLQRQCARCAPRAFCLCRQVVSGAC